ncbi:hypothetical protein HY090_00935 [Candidatus Kaiserbacteria bacterium]|nr:hypothetical protein [Candidatus Kaiserbacteria bacterium]
MTVTFKSSAVTILALAIVFLSFAAIARAETRTPGQFMLPKNPVIDPLHPRLPGAGEGSSTMMRPNTQGLGAIDTKIAHMGSTTMGERLQQLFGSTTPGHPEDRVKKALKRLATLILATIERMQSQIDRMKSRADKIDQRGGNTAAARADIAAAQTELDTAKSELQSLQSTLGLVLNARSLAATAAGTNLTQGPLQSVRVHLENAQKSLRKASQELMQAAMAIINNGHEGNASTTPGSISVNASNSFASNANSSQRAGILGYKFTGFVMIAGSVEPVRVKSIRWKQSGTGTAAALKKVKTVMNGVAYPATLSADGTHYVSNFGSGIVVEGKNPLDVYVSGDIAQDATVGKTIIFDVEKNTDISAVGKNSDKPIVPALGATAPSGTRAVLEITSGTPYIYGAQVTISEGV